MPKYNEADFDPPAPVAYVTLRHPATGVSVSDVPMLIDTGADVTLLPVAYLAEFEMEVDADTKYEVQGFGGEAKSLGAVQLEMIFWAKNLHASFY